MEVSTVITLIRELGQIVLTLAGPLLLAGLVIGLLISILQVVTSIHDPTLSFIPRILVVMLVGLALIGWMMETAVSYTVRLYSQISVFAQ